MARRFSGPGKPYEFLTAGAVGGPVWTGEIRLVPETLDQPLRWRKPRRIFVASMADLFHEAVSDYYLDAVFAIMALCPQHTFQVLTKRPARMRRWFSETASGASREQLVYGATGKTTWPGWPLPNVEIGVSAENQRRLDERLPDLLATPAAVRFVSLEPLLEEIDLPSQIEDRFTTANPPGSAHPFMERMIDWVIVGGETGPDARQCRVEWVRSIVEQCRAAKVSVFVKQLGSFPTVAEPHEGWPGRTLFEGGYPDDRTRVRLASRNGSDPEEWLEDLRCREFPERQTRPRSDDTGQGKIASPGAASEASG
jgi:protein gp37